MNDITVLESPHEANMVTWNALTNKRGAIVLEIEQLEKRIAELKAQLIHLDATLRIFRPDFAAEGLPVKHRRRTKSPYFEHGEVTERIFDMLHKHGTVSSADVGEQLMREKALDPEHDRVVRTDFVRRITLQMREQMQRGLIERIGGRGPTSRWRLKTQADPRAGKL
jgi:hypothetical protein